MRKWGEWWYPDSEERLCRNHSSSHIIKEILPYCHDRDVCVQAGGAVGVWPIIFSKYFQTVLTFEPNMVLRGCLLRNLHEHKIENVTYFPYALWDSEAKGRLTNIQDNNMGAWHVDPEGEAFMMAPLDACDFEGRSVDLIQLDIEGAEMHALEGAQETIRRHRPVIVVETKSSCLGVFGYEAKDLRNRLYSMGYAPQWRKSRDELWLPT